MKTTQEIQGQLEIFERTEGIAPLRFFGWQGRKVFPQLGSNGMTNGDFIAFVVRWYKQRHPKRNSCRVRCGFETLPPNFPREGVIRHPCGCAIAAIVIPADTVNVSPLIRAAIDALTNSTEISA